MRGGWLLAGLMAIGLAGMAAVPGLAEQRFWTPKTGSDERKVVLNAARVPVEKDVGQPVQFRIKTLRVTPDWAFVFGTPQRADGRPIDYSKTIYAEDVKAGTFSGEAAVLMARDGAGWRVITYSVGFGDVVWDSWDEEFGAPAWLWP